MNRIISPPEYKNFNNPIIFLAGPIQGTDDWQTTAAGIIHRLEPKIVIANPRRSVKFEGEFGKDMYNEQVDWETHYLREAFISGAILFWHAKENEHNCNRAYAQTTRFEFGEWTTYQKIEGEKLGKTLAIGIEEGYSGAKYIRRRVGQDLPYTPLHATLEETCKYAVQKILDQGTLSDLAESEFDQQDHWVKRRW